MLEISLILGSTRIDRNTPRLARLLYRHMQGREDMEAELLDLGGDYDLPLLHERLRYLDDPPETLVRLGERLDRADALVIATPEYNKGYPAVLKNAIDALGSEIRRKPVGIACHSIGSFGGSVVLQMIKPVLMNLGGVPIPASMTIPRIEEAIDEDGNALEEGHDDRAERFLDELVWYARALKAAREADG